MALFGLLPSGVAEQGAKGLNYARSKEMGTPGKGLFGISGGFRDVLGSFGDALLVANGRDPIYAPAVHQEDVKRAMMGYNIDPQGSIDTLMNVDPGTAIKLQDRFDAQKGQAEAQAAKARAAQLSEEEKVTGMAASLLHGVRGRPEAWAATVKVINDLAKKRGARLPVDLEDAYNEDVINQYGGLAVSLKDRETLDRQAAIEDRNERKLQSDVALRGGKLKSDAAYRSTTLRLKGAEIDNKANNPSGKTGKKSGIARPASVKTNGPIKVDRATGQLLYRQPDGSYKPK